MLILLCLSILLAAVPTLSRLDFNGHKLYGMYASDESKLSFLQDLLMNSFKHRIDVWNEPVLIKRMVNVRVPTLLTSDFEENLKSQGIEFNIITDDLQKWIDLEREANPADSWKESADGQVNFPLDVYHTFEAISAYMDAIANHYSEIASVKEIGETFEGNKIKGLKISSGGSEKPAIWIDAGYHAREWIAPATAVYIIDKLVKGYYTEGEHEIKDLLDNFDWYIFPVINIDGYIYTWTFDRMWRKNRAPILDVFNTNPVCIGIDVNRNFDAAFGEKGSSDEPCSESYGGEFAFSESESRAVRDGVLSIGDGLKAYVDLHSYSQLLLTPYGYKIEKPKDYQYQMAALTAMTEAITNTHSKEYIFGPIAATLYPASGNSVDWAYDTAKVKYSMAFELRDNGTQGFLLDKQQIIPTGEEVFAALKVLTNIIKSEI